MFKGWEKLCRNVSCKNKRTELLGMSRDSVLYRSQMYRHQLVLSLYQRHSSFFIYIYIESIDIYRYIYSFNRVRLLLTILPLYFSHQASYFYTPKYLKRVSLVWCFSHSISLTNHYHYHMDQHVQVIICALMLSLDRMVLCSTFEKFIEKFTWSLSLTNLKSHFFFFVLLFLKLCHFIFIFLYIERYKQQAACHFLADCVLCVLYTIISCEICLSITWIVWHCATMRTMTMWISIEKRDKTKQTILSVNGLVGALNKPEGYV